MSEASVSEEFPYLFLPEAHSETRSADAESHFPLQPDFPADVGTCRRYGPCIADLSTGRGDRQCDQLPFSPARLHQSGLFHGTLCGARRPERHRDALPAQEGAYSTSCGHGSCLHAGNRRRRCGLPRPLLRLWGRLFAWRTERLAKSFRTDAATTSSRCFAAGLAVASSCLVGSISRLIR